MKKYLFLFSWIFVFCSCSKEKANTEVQGSSEFPILAWIGVPEEETTVERFIELKESGININFSGYSNIEAVEKALDAAQEAGVKLLPSCPELKTEPEKTAGRLMKHPALIGYHLRDEPSALDFPQLAEWVKRIQSVDSEHGCYINLFPNYANKEQLFGNIEIDSQRDVYAQHVEVFLKEVPVPFISFDHYPIIEVEGVRTLRPEWYKNLEIIAEASRKSGRPFWAFALAIAHIPYPIPTLAELRLQMFSNLAYGAQTLQYFTYWHPGINSTWDFHDSPINLNGKRTIVYNLIKTVNSEIHSLAPVFFDSKVVSVCHTGEQIPIGTHSMENLPKPIKTLKTSGTGAVVSVLKKENQRFLVIVNRNFQNSMQLNISTDKTVQKVLKDGTFAKLNNFSEEVNIDPGDLIIYTWKE
jgi:hypothetical protein